MIAYTLPRVTPPTIRRVQSAPLNRPCWRVAAVPRTIPTSRIALSPIRMMARHGTRSRNSRRWGASTVVASLISLSSKRCGWTLGPPAASSFFPCYLSEALAEGLFQLQGCVEDRVVDVPAFDLVDGDGRAGLAVTVLVAGEAARDALEPRGRSQLVPQLGLGDQEPAVVGLDGHGLDRVEQHVRCVEGVGVEGRRRLLAELLLVRREELVLVEVTPELQARAGQVHPLGVVRTGRVDEVGREEAVGPRQRDVVVVRVLPGLRGDQPALGQEDRVEQDLRRVRGDAGQQRTKVRVPDLDGLLGGALTAVLAREHVAEDLLEPVRVGAAVVDRGGRGGAELLRGELGHGSALDPVVVRRP